jgi:glycosyltransferase involved in cell wall biosynthesis
MKIAILAPIVWRTPPRQYGPWEQVSSVLTEALVAKGMDVTLFATGDSITKAKLQWVCEHPTAETGADQKVWECLHISHLAELASSFDVIHNHFDFLPLTYSRLMKRPFITTIHGFSSEEIIPVYKKYNRSTFYVSISDSDRHPALEYLDTVYNGLDETQFSEGNGNGDYLLYFGRIHPHKGAAEAIQIAINTGKKLLLCGLVQDHQYFNEKVKPYIDDEKIIYKGNVGPAERNHLLGGAIALLHPISFEEPFGLSVAESMLCGTPVIAFNRGSMKELVVNGQSGFLVDTIEEAIAALDKVKTIDRAQCRKYAMEKFSSETMALHYIRLYEQVLRRTDTR